MGYLKNTINKHNRYVLSQCIKKQAAPQTNLSFAVRFYVCFGDRNPFFENDAGTHFFAHPLIGYTVNL
jgi:hypothetical protein